MPMPNRHIQDANGYRYAYQGQEKDSETGKEAFELRLWDARIGRWLTTDPAGQYHSPYLGMGNNPIITYDKDGAKGETDFVDKNGNLVYTDGINNGIVYTINDRATFTDLLNHDLTNGTDLKTLAATMIINGGEFIGSRAEYVDYIKSVGSKAGFSNITIRTMSNQRDGNNNLKDGYAFIGSNVKVLANGSYEKTIGPRSQWQLVGYFDSNVRKESLWSYYNLLNSLEHESFHLIQAYSMMLGVHKLTYNTEGTYKRAVEIPAINYQRSRDSFKNTTSNYQNGIKGYETWINGLH